ncbi:MAG: FAD-binding oxidoreductase [Cytophagaceae bacterium]|nr:FAD-binding oxidoreductase [Cytophagaceae bacterium]
MLLQLSPSHKLVLPILDSSFQQLAASLEGELHTDMLHKAIYATDASVYRAIPQAVVYPKHVEDIKQLIAFAKAHNTSLIPRTAGTSLAGQCVGEGIVVDVSKHFTQIIGLDLEKKQITVAPGVIRDELNAYVKPYGLFFGPNTSTANRCMIGGMVGNNSSGTTSIKYGVTRQKVVRLKTVLADGSEAIFEDLSLERFREKLSLTNTEGAIYNTIDRLLKTPAAQAEIREHYPKASIHRRNNGYALDALIEQQPYSQDGPMFNLSALLTGSEGTLAFTTEITLQLDDLPPAYGVVVATHHHSIAQCMQAVVPAMEHELYTCEMMDKIILDCTKNNKEQQQNRFFVQGDPAAILMLEVRDHSLEGARLQAEALIQRFDKNQLSYAHPVLEGKQINQAMALRKAGLGLLGNMIGDRKAVACIEDTAVALEDLEAFIGDFSLLMDSFNQQAVYYAHAGAGELHLRPILDLKKGEDVSHFRAITTAVAKLVKSYQGAMSGEHGDGIVRSEFIEFMLGEANYQRIEAIKKAFDPDHIFNPGKIVTPLPMDQSLRYTVDREEPQIDTLFNFEDQQGILRATEKCNGSGDCRKLPAAGGVMCPSYRATRNEKDTTRARANALREFLTTSQKSNRFDHQELKEVFDLCISCKACASECPSNVDVATLKAEFEYQYQQQNGSSLRTKLFAHNTRVLKAASLWPWLYNSALKLTARPLKRSLGVAQCRDLPPLERFSPIRPQKDIQATQPQKVLLFIDEFTEYLDGAIGRDAHQLLLRLGYEVQLLRKADSGRSYISKGFLKEAKATAQSTVARINRLITKDTVIVGIEPSAILTFKDEYLRLVDDQEAALQLAAQSFLIDEFLDLEREKGAITSAHFTNQKATLKIHGHCHQKALSSVGHTFNMLNLPTNYTPTIIASGCCGMAGSFGYEKEHYEVSMNIGEQSLFPAVRKAATDVIIVANGTSCRHQIKDGTSKKALHPATVLLQALAS